jgi:acetyl esterase/lipase
MDCRILYLHGGSFMWYSGVDSIYQPLTSRIAAAAGMPVLVIDFRLSPEFTCVDAIEDCLDALVWMDMNGPDGPSKARKLFVCGDSSGGGQALATMLAARDGLGSKERDTDRPPTPKLDGCCAICPLADLSCDVRRSPLNSYRTRKWDAATQTGDPVFTDSSGNLVTDMRQLQKKYAPYVGSTEQEGMKFQLASPYWAQNWRDLPPIMFLSADEDVTVDDAVDIAARALAAGVEVDLCVWPRMFHCWQCYTEGRDKNGQKSRPFVEAIESIRHIGVYFQRLAARE